MQYLFFDAAVNGYYALTLLKQAFSLWLPLMPEEEKISEDVSPFIFQTDWAQAKIFFGLNDVTYSEIIFIETPATLEEIQIHFQQFVIQEINGRLFYFRFWSASVFKKFIEGCNAEQQQRFFGPVQKFVCSNQQGVSFTYSLEGGVMKVAADNGDTYTSNDADKMPQQTIADNNFTTSITVELNSKKAPRKFFS